mmetsp:Transcript_18083/g.59072  ORF Transcript_18083/g.59072 Transcript_18083/m.59072 type:complete len:238 (+) Transcript_18083:358-1071(+)
MSDVSRGRADAAEPILRRGVLRAAICAIEPSFVGEGCCGCCVRSRRWGCCCAEPSRDSPAAAAVVSVARARGTQPPAAPAPAAARGGLQPEQLLRLSINAALESCSAPEDPILPCEPVVHCSTRDAGALAVANITVGGFHKAPRGSQPKSAARGCVAWADAHGRACFGCAGAPAPLSLAHACSSRGSPGIPRSVWGCCRGGCASLCGGCARTCGAAPACLGRALPWTAHRVPDAEMV